MHLMVAVKFKGDWKRVAGCTDGVDFSSLVR